MSARLAALAAQYVGRRVQLAVCPGCRTGPAYRTVPADPWDRHEVCPSCRYCYTHAGEPVGTITRVTSRGFTVTLDRVPAMGRGVAPPTVRGVTDSEVSRYVD